MNSKTVFVGLSGGVDSSVAALRLLKQGYNVVGVFIKVWHPDFMVCNWEEERLDAMRVAAHLNIPFLTCDGESAYKKEVADYFIAEYIAGRTPNPDVLCNKAVKFGVFLDFALKQGADFIATGHYVQKINEKLYRGVDNQKDQSYFLWMLTKEQISYSLFPVGSSSKEQIRKEAEKANIPTAQKKDSQGICFLGHIDIAEFISHYKKLVPGNVVDSLGKVIGSHKGALVYTLGQRHGFELHDKNSTRTNMFVVSKDIDANTITVAPEPRMLKETETMYLNNHILRTSITSNKQYSVQFRYRQEPLPAQVYLGNDQLLEIKLATPTEKPASGQSCVIYDENECIGGGIFI